MTENQSSPKIRIAFVLWTLKTMGGSEHVVFDIVRKLDLNQFEILVIGLSDGPVRKRYEDIGIKVETVFKKSKFDFNFVQKFRQILVSNKIEIVNPHHFYPLLYTSVASVFTGIKIVYTEHSVWQYLELGLVKKMISNLLLAKADAVIAISRQLLKYYSENPFVSERKTHLIINGIDLCRFKKLDDLPLKEQLGFKPQDKLIGLVANLRPEKNHKVLIRAFASLLKAHPSVHLVFAGLDCMDGQLESYVQAMEVAESVHFLGARQDIPEILNILDVFCLPSKNEGLPLSILEAMACGVPVIGADVMGINEVLTDNETGLLFPYDDDRALCEKLDLLLTDQEKRETMVASAAAYVKATYSLENKMNQYRSLFQNLLNYKKNN